MGNNQQYPIKILHAHRLDEKYPERVVVSYWFEYNQAQPAIDFGLRPIDHILNTRVINPMPPGHDYSEDVDPVSARDEQVVAAVLQWLGTKHGKLFLEEMERRIAVERQKQHYLHDLNANHGCHRCLLHNTIKPDPDMPGQAWGLYKCGNRNCEQRYALTGQGLPSEIRDNCGIIKFPTRKLNEEH